MLIVIAVISILAIAGLTWLFNRTTPFKICPICAGVSGTWLWMLIGMAIGQLPTSNFQLPTAILMGGSVVGIAYQIEKYMPPSRSPLLWKTLFIPAGFVAVYSVLSSWWAAFIIITTVLAILVLRFTEKPRSRATESDKTVEELEKKMKKCC